MLSATSNTTPLLAQTAINLTIPGYVTIINPDGSVSYERSTQYQQPTIIRRSYAKSKVSKQRYTIEQVYFTKINLVSHVFSSSIS